MSTPNVSRTCSPTRSIKKSRSSCDESAWTLLITAAGPETRWRVSCTSRAFSSATLRLPATVVRSCRSPSSNRGSRRTFGGGTPPAAPVGGRDRARRLPAEAERDEQDRFRGLTAEKCAAVPLRLGGQVLDDQ